MDSFLNHSLHKTLSDAVGAGNVLAGQKAAPWSRDWSGAESWRPLAVVRPSHTGQVAAILRIAAKEGVPVVPVGGNTGLVGGTQADGALMLSLDRMSRIREVRPAARVAVVEAGAILQTVHDAAEAHDLVFPLTFGARGSAMIGGCLSTNAGGSNVVRYGNARTLCLGIEAVLPDGRVLALTGGLHKDNSGYDLRDLLIGAEGTLGIITAAALRLFPRPRAHATAMVACAGLGEALSLLNTLQEETGGAVEAFEYMPGAYIDACLQKMPDMRPPFQQRHDVNILVEVAALAPRDAVPDATGSLPVVAHLEAVLTKLFEQGAVLDAVVARNQAQRSRMWARREASAQVRRLGGGMVLDFDVAVPTDLMPALLERIETQARAIDPKVTFVNVAHLGDGNLHVAARPNSDDPQVHAALKEAIEGAATGLGGSFSAEHGVGVSKLSAMRRLKDPVALDMMRQIKHALDPQNIMNPGKLIP